METRENTYRSPALIPFVIMVAIALIVVRVAFWVVRVFASLFIIKAQKNHQNS